jgi:hypothetical protein
MLSNQHNNNQNYNNEFSHYKSPKNVSVNLPKVKN